ncbi:ArsR/SmtB family transcription factor [Kiritimatiella glycovorans]|uniref:Putative methyltransferase YcgJ n=1 Tax=Kiritimatiella glycovorans TaxID=1307763 RepID=A0A0G3EGH6_9BACT|nr:metalloregulator ArsR/SmtB family transcription factor [Kiritimatiella glycovorans]AKJ65443.1 putative methyltransferase YcgJ [Kiritimatiella glycovorans]
MTESLDIFRALADEARLRMVRSLGIAELSVAELTSVLDMPQSSVSRHLKPLRETGIVELRRDGTSNYYRRGPLFEDQAFEQFMGRRLAELAGGEGDRERIRRVLEQRRNRSREFFDRIAGRYETLTEPGGGWRALAAALAVGFEGCRVADLGCGEGELALLLARFAERVYAVDMSPQMLEVFQQRARERGVEERISGRIGDLEHLPLEDGSLDAVFVSQSLHHAARPDAALGEAARVLREDGKLVLLELARHEQEWTREEWADQWLGFEEDQLREWFAAAGFDTDRMERISGMTPDIDVLLAVARKEQSQETENGTYRSTAEHG